jgi:hypothetical protein
MMDLLNTLSPPIRSTVQTAALYHGERTEIDCLAIKSVRLGSEGGSVNTRTKGIATNGTQGWFSRPMTYDSGARL